MGNLGADPEMRYSQAGKPRVKFRLATRHARKLEDGSWEELTTWHNVVVFGPMAENCAKYLTKGRGVLVEGRLNERTWEDDNGVKKWITEVIAREVVFLPGRGQQDSAGPAASSLTQPQAQDADVPF